MALPETTFYRSVRNYPEPLPSAAVQIETPPQMPQVQGGASALLQLLYPLSGVGMMLVMIFSTRAELNPILLIAEVSIVPFSVGLMFLSNFLQRRGQKQKHVAERKVYQGYLESIERHLTEIAKAQMMHHERLYPEPRQLPEISAQRQVLWERRPADQDFLSVRVGLAPMALCCPISFQEHYKGGYEPDLLQEARDLVTRYSHIDAQPLVIPLGELGTVSITGPREASCGLVRSMLAQIVAFHAPGEVRILTSFPRQAAREWSWLKWLPHTRRLRPAKATQAGEPEQYCLLAETIADLQVILETQVGPELERRRKLNEEKRAGEGEEYGAQESRRRRKIPHLIIVLDGYTRAGLLSRVAGLEDVMRESVHLGITVICLAAAPEQEPALTRARLKLSPFLGGYQLSYKETAYGGQQVEFVSHDTLDVLQCESIARGLAPLQLVDREAEVDYAQNVGLLSLHAIADLDRWNVTHHWQHREEKQVLRVPIGVQKAAHWCWISRKWLWAAMARMDSWSGRRVRARANSCARSSQAWR